MTDKPLVERMAEGAALGMTKESADEFSEWVKRSAKQGKHCPPAVEGKDLIVMAMGPSRGQCPFDAETWILNTGYIQVAEMHGKFDKLFLVHRQVYNPTTGNAYFDWKYIESLPGEFISLHKVKEIKHKLYPFKRICEKFHTDYFSDTIAYMIAYAIDKSTKVDGNGKLIYKGPYNHLRLYGVDMQEGEEYEYEKGGLEFWLGMAQGVGMGYTISFGSTLLTTYGGKPYGRQVNKNILDPNRLLRRKLKPSTEEGTQLPQALPRAPFKVIPKYWDG